MWRSRLGRSGFARIESPGHEPSLWGPPQWLGALLLATVVNGLLLICVYRLVETRQHEIPKLLDLNFVDFVRLKEEPPPTEPPRRPPDRLPPPEQPLAMPKLAMPQLRQPRIPKLNVHAPSINVPLDLTSGPYIGEMAPPGGDVGFKIDDLEIEENVVPLYRTAPLYPPKAMRARLEGVVLVEFIITPEGLVHSTAIVRADPPGIFDHAVLIATKKWKFKPKIVGGRAVPRRARQEVRFSLEKK